VSRGSQLTYSVARYLSTRTRCVDREGSCHRAFEGLHRNSSPNPDLTLRTL